MGQLENLATRNSNYATRNSMKRTPRARGGRLYFYQPCQDGADEVYPLAAEKCRFTECQSKMEFGRRKKLRRLTEIFSNLIVADVGIIYINLLCLGSINLVAKITQYASNLAVSVTL